MPIQEMAESARSASVKLAAMTSEQKNRVLQAIADALQKHKTQIIAANEKDLQAAAAEQLAMPLQKRLRFDDQKLAESIAGVNSLQQLSDPVGKVLSATELDQKLTLTRVSCPIGVLGVIFESRPDALVQISTLALKSGNAVLLKGGREAQNSNTILAKVISEASLQAGAPEGWLQLMQTRADVNKMLELDDWIDLIIPRGSNEFVKYIMENSNIPVMGHADGICHVYVDAKADLKMAEEVVLDSKCQYVSVCNALETLLVHQDVAKEFLPKVADRLRQHNVKLIGCPLVAAYTRVQLLDEEDYQTEYLDYVLAIHIVSDLDEAIEHINEYGSGHTDAIITEDKQAAQRFFNEVDSGNVFWNCSTRFSDGYRYGLGAEVGISTSKLHARGPVGLDGLVIYKWLLQGNGQIVADYAEGKKQFTHRTIKTDNSDQCAK